MDPLQTVPVQPIPSSNGPSLLDQKRAEVAQASQQKQSEIAPSQQLLSEYNADRVTLSNIELRNKYGEHLARQQEAKQLRQYFLDQTARRNRTSGELTQDGALSVLAGGVNLVAGLPVALEDLTLRGVYGLGQLGAMGLNASGVLSDEHFNQFVDATNKDREAFVGPQQQVLGKFNNWRNAKSSVVKQADQAVMGQENAAVEAQNQQAYDQAIKRGDNAAAAMLLREAKNSWQGARNLFNHSSSLADMITEQLPTLGVGAVAKSLVAESKVASLAAKIAGEGASKEVLAAATKKAEETLLHRNISKVVTATEVGSNYGQQAGDIQTAPLKDLIERFPQVRAQLDAGVPEADIRNKLASDTAMTTATLTAPIAYGSSILSRPFLAHVGGKGVPATLKKFGVNVAEQAGEAGEEYLQGAGGQIAQNVANKQAGDTSVQDILQGAGEQAGQGAAAALGSAAAARAPGLAVGGAVLAGKAGLATAIGAGKLTIDGLAKVANATGKPDKAKAAQQAPVQAQKAEVGAQMDKNADTLSKGFQAQSVPTADGVVPEPTPAAKVATAPVESSPMLDPKEVAALKQNQEDPAAPLDTVTALSRAVQMLNDAPEHHSSISGLSLFAMKAARQLRQHMDTITDPVMKDAANKLLNSEWVTHLEEQAQHVTDDQINQAVAELPADTVPKDAPMTPEGRQALARTAELAALVPEKLSTEQTKRALLQSQHLTPEEIHQLEQANKLARVRESFQASTEALAKQQPSIKKFTEVTANIFNKGFQLGNKELPSLNTMAGNVVRALGNGHTQVALQSMKEMRQFVQSRIDRATAFDQAARQHVENGSVENQRVKVAGTRQLATETSLGKEANYVDVTNPGSRALIDVVHSDASAAAEFFNTLAAENPSLNQQAIEAPAEASWKSMTKGDGVAVPGSATASPKAAPAAKSVPAPKVAPVVAKPATGITSTMKAAAEKVKGLLDYANNRPANATAELTQQHIETLKRAERYARKSMEDVNPDTQMDLYDHLDGIRTTAAEALKTLQEQQATDAKMAEEEAPAKVEEAPAPKQEPAPVTAAVEETPAPAETKKPTTVAERFPGLTETLGEVTDSTPAGEKQARSNKFLSSFKLAGKSQSLFTRFADPMTALKEAFAKGISGVRDLYVEDLRYLNPTEAQMGAMEALLVHVAPEISRRMNEHLLQTAKGTGKSQGFLQNLLNPAEAKTAKGKTKVEWAFSNRLPLHAAVWGTDADGKPFLHYQEGIVQAVSIAAVHWLMNQQNAPIDFDEEKLDKRFPNMSEELRSAFRTMANKDALLERLASDIQQVMGVHADGDASQSYTAGIPLALAQQAIVAMQQMGMLEVVPVEAGTNAETGKATTVTFLRMNKNAQTKGINPQALRDALGQPALLTRLLMPDSRTLPFIGKPAKVISDLMTRTRQKLAKGQLLALKKYGEVPYHANTHFIQDMKALGKDVYLLLRGFDIQDTSKLNRNHADSVEGKNRSLEAAWDAVMELDAQVGMYADANATEDGNSLTGVKVFFPASMGSNTRMFMDASVNPQGDKDMREAFVPTEAKYDFANNPRHMALWFSAIGQALDLGWKVEQIASPEVLSQMVQERLAEKDFSKVLEAWQAMQAAEPGSKEQRSLAKKVHFLLSKIYGDKAVPAHGLHALSDLARYHASEDKGSFTSALPIEIDGKTDGPFHATWHLGLHAFGKKTLQQLRQSGALINTSMRSLNEGGSALGDMYKNVGKAAKGLIQDKLAKLVEKPLARKSMQATIGLLRMIDHVEVVRDEDGKPVDYNVTRAPGKLATTPIIYGSSANSVLKTMANAIISSVYKQLSESIASGEPLSPALQERLQATMGFYKESGEAKYAPKFDLSDPAKYKDFSFDPAHRKALVYSLKNGAGGSLTESVETELAPVLDTFKSLYKAAAFQMFQYQTEFNAAREDLRLQRVEEGKLGPNDALSRNDEQQLLQDLNAKAPIYQLMHSAGLSKDFGISIVKTDTGGRHVVNGEEQQVRAMGAGHLSAHIPAVILRDAGVRIAALLVQGLGDASMITELGTNNPDGMLPVFDGLGVSPLEFAKWGKEANQAVLKTILFNGLKSVNDSFANSDMDFSKIDRSQLDALVEALRPDQDTAAELEDAADAEVVAYLENTRSDERAKLLHRADVIDATKRALLTEGRTQVSQDHMAGAGPEGAVQIEGPIKNDQVLIAEIKARVAEQVGKPAESTKPTENPKTVSDVLANLSKDGLKTLDSLTLQRLINNMPLQGKIRQFVYKQIAHLLPNDLQVHVGTHAEIAAKQAELFPDVDFGTERDVGATYENHVFVENNSEETLVHELVHAAVTSLLSRYYQHDGKGLNQSQKTAIAELEKLAQLFAATKVTRAMHPRIVDALRAVQGHLAGGQKGAAVNEFLAWSMTNGAVQQNLAKTPLSLPAQFKAITKTALGIIRRLLSLPKNESVDSFLAQALSNFRQLTQRAPIEDGLDVGSDALFQSLSGSEDERLAELSDKLGWLRTNFPKDGTEEGDAILQELTNNERAQKAMDKAESIRRAFEDAGFQFTEAGRHVFTQMQALLATNMQLDSRALDGMQHLYEEVMPYLSEDDFTTPEQYEALQAIGTKEGDLNERSNMLANFISLALVDPTLREKLADLKPAKPNVDKSTFDKRLRSYGTAVFDTLTDASNGRRKGDSQLVVLDRLVAQLDKNQRATLRRQNAKGSLMDRAESVVKKGIGYVGEKAAAIKDARHDAGLVGGVDGLINGVLNIAHAMSSPEGSEAFGEGLLSLSNKASATNPIAKLLRELVSRTGSNAQLVNLLDKSKWAVSHVRQRLREEAPAQVRALFKEPLSKETWKLLTKAVGKADMAALMDNYTRTEIQEMLDNPEALDKAIKALHEKLGEHGKAYIEGAQDMAHYMMTGDNISAGLLYRNAHALSRLSGSQTAVDPEKAAKVAPYLDRLASLYAMQKLSQEDRKATAELMAKDSDGMEKLLRLMKTLGRREYAKLDADKQLLNAQKGYLPESMDPRSHLVLAGLADAADRVKRGYRFVGSYQGDASDVNADHYGYYAIDTVGGQATYNQGALQTVVSSIGGADHLTGRSNNVAVQTMIMAPHLVEAITKSKHEREGLGDRNLIPLFNADGEIIGYQRTLSSSMISTHLRTNDDLAQSIGNWMGRQAEETFSRELNMQLGELLHKDWDKNKEKLGDEYIDISHSDAKSIQDGWNSIPPYMRKHLKELFHGPVMVRKNQVDMAIGYRAASIADVFTGMSDLDEKTQQAIADAALGFLGKDAYRKLVRAERIVQGVVGMAKETIVVKSLTVGLANFLSNNFQLLMHGVPPWRLLQVQSAKARELETYMRRDKRISQLSIQLATTTNPALRKKLNREHQALHDANTRLSIWPLIESGELPSIAEGLSENDEYSIMHDFATWISEKTKDFPPGVISAAKMATLAKGTALHQGLNRLVQFGDFMAKAVLYDDQIARGKSKEEALSYINDRFVNYNIPAGRTRDYLESMGLIWFWNYKLRIQKVVLATIRDNPIRFLMWGLTAGHFNVGNLLSENALNTNWSYSIGPGQLPHAGGMLMWSQLFGR